MQITRITPQPSYKAVNQKYYEWAKKCYSLEKNVSSDWLDRIRYDVFLFKQLSRQDAIDTVEAVKKYMGKTNVALEEILKNFTNPND